MRVGLISVLISVRRALSFSSGRRHNELQIPSPLPPVAVWVTGTSCEIDGIDGTAQVRLGLISVLISVSRALSFSSGR